VSRLPEAHQARLSIDIVSGSAGDDTLVGPSNDGVQDKLDGGLNTDTCQGPPPDPDSLASCENTTSPPLGSPVGSPPGSSPGSPLASSLCADSGGTFTTLGLLYTCTFPGLFMDHDAEAARNVCKQSSAVFADLPLVYTCALPASL